MRYRRSIQSFEQLGDAFEVGVAALAGVAAVGAAIAVAVGAVVAHLDIAADEGGRETLHLHPAVDAMHLHDIPHLGIAVVTGILKQQVVHFLLLLLAQFVEGKALAVVEGYEILAGDHAGGLRGVKMAAKDGCCENEERRG